MLTMMENFLLLLISLNAWKIKKMFIFRNKKIKSFNKYCPVVVWLPYSTKFLFECSIRKSVFEKSTSNVKVWRVKKSILFSQITLYNVFAEVWISTYFRSSRPDLFCKKGVLRKEPATLLKKRLWHRCFPVNFVKFLRTPFYIKHLWWLLLIFVKK